MCVCVCVYTHAYTHTNTDRDKERHACNCMHWYALRALDVHTLKGGVAGRLTSGPRLLEQRNTGPKDHPNTRIS